jgi:hypothetical protein
VSKSKCCVGLTNGAGDSLGISYDGDGEGETALRGLGGGRNSDGSTFAAACAGGDVGW